MYGSVTQYPQRVAEAIEVAGGNTIYFTAWMQMASEFCQNRVLV